MHYVNVIMAGVFFFCQSCASQKSVRETSEVEVIDYHFRQFAHGDSLLRKPFWYWTERIWRKDSLVIEQVRYIKIDGDSKGDTTTFPVLLYRYTDLRTATRYEFKSFSDTATLIRKFKHHDTIRIYGGWGLYKKKRDLVGDGRIEYRPDTTINGRQYRHAMIFRRRDSINYVYDMWILPYKKVTRFSLDYGTYVKTGQPVVGYHIYPQGNRGLKAVYEIEFIADTLSEVDEKVFATWEKYAREHPVKEP